MSDVIARRKALATPASQYFPRVSVPPDVFRQLSTAAAMQGCNTRQLITSVLTVVAAEPTLARAILDD
jgi:hypothetical protein